MAIAATVNALSPRGKTPLSAAVIQAAEALKYTEEAANVILIFGGIETCNLDPCEVGRQLEQAGVNFTAHVIGFDVTDPLVWRIYDMDGTLLVETTAPHSAMTLQQLPGAYRIQATRPLDNESVGRDIQLTDENLTVTLVFPAYIPPATLDAPEVAPAGSLVAVTWAGPDGEGDFITSARSGITAMTAIAIQATATRCACRSLMRRAAMSCDISSGKTPGHYPPACDGAIIGPLI